MEGESRGDAKRSVPSWPDLIRPPNGGQREFAFGWVPGSSPGDDGTVKFESGGLPHPYRAQLDRAFARVGIGRVDLDGVGHLQLDVEHTAGLKDRLRDGEREALRFAGGDVDVPDVLTIGEDITRLPGSTGRVR